MRSLTRLLLSGVMVAFAGRLSPLAAQQKASEKAPEVTVLTGAPLGGVKFLHAAHEKKTKCAECHHVSKPEKALQSPHQPCGDCHTKIAAPPMKTNARDAFHNVTGKVGLCVDCHVKQAAAGKMAPIKCAGCHKKENVAL